MTRDKLYIGPEKILSMYPFQGMLIYFHSTQGGVASLLTLGCNMYPLRGKESVFRRAFHRTLHWPKAIHYIAQGKRVFERHPGSERINNDSLKGNHILDQGFALGK